MCLGAFRVCGVFRGFFRVFRAFRTFRVFRAFRVFGVVLRMFMISI